MKKSDVIKLVEKHVPTNWLHPLMTGDRKVVHDAPYYNRDIEKLCLEIKKELLKAVKEFGNLGSSEVDNV